jgi:hypothetical protein
MSSTSCYTMALIAPTTLIIMTSPTTTITEIPLSTLIFGPSTITFDNDIDAYTTDDIN